MSWFPDDILVAVDKVARIYYVNKDRTKLWNNNKRGEELRMLTGWTWAAKDGSISRAGFKTPSVAIRDAFYTLVRHQEVPQTNLDAKARLALVKARKSA